MIIKIINDVECRIHTTTPTQQNNISRCRCRLISDPLDERPFNLTTATKSHLKFINLLKNDYRMESFENFVKYLALYNRTKPLRFVYVMKIVSTIIRYLRHIDVFDSENCKRMLNKYGMVKCRYFDTLLQEELKSLPRSHQISYLNANSMRPLAIDDRTIKEMLNRSIRNLELALVDRKDENNKKFIADIIFYTLIILSFYTGARTVATLYRLTIGQYRNLLSYGEIDVFGKNNVKITVYLVDNVRQKYRPLLELPMCMFEKRRDLNRNNNEDDSNYVFADDCSVKQLHARFDKLYKDICKVERRPEWIKWHAARRWFLGEVFSNCGLKIAAKAVSHKHIKTTVRYIQASTHSKDVRSQLNKVFGVV